MMLKHLLAAVALATILPVAAQDYPAKTVRIVVSFTAGGTTDIIARQVAGRLAHHWKQTVIVENKPGAGGTLGTDYVVSQPADGYTFLMSSSGPMAISPMLGKKLVTDPLTALEPVVLVADVANVLVTAPDYKSKTIPDLVNLTETFLAGLSPFSRSARQIQRRFHGRAHDESLDSAGRVRLPGHLLEHAGLDGPCVVVGVDDHLEIWSPDRWREHNAEIDAEADRIAEELAAGAADG